MSLGTLSPPHRTRRRFGLHTRLLGSFLLLSLLPLFGSNAVGYLRSRQIVETQVERFLRQISDLQAGFVSEHVQLQLAYLGAIGAGNRFLQAAADRHDGRVDETMAGVARPEAVSEYLDRQVAESDGRFTGLALFALDGTLIGSSQELPKAYRHGGPAAEAVTVVRGASTESAPTLRYMVPVTTSSGESVAYLAATISVRQAEPFLSSPEHLVGGAEWFLLDAANRPVFISHPHEGVSYGAPLGSPLSDLPPGSEGRYANAEGIEVIGTSVRVPGSSWTLLTEIPAASALGELRSLRSLSLVSGAAFTLLVLVVGWLLASGIVAPLHTLSAATQRLAGGDLSIRVPAERRDEIGALSHAFNDMAHDLKARDEEIAELHEREIARAEQLATVGELAAGLAHEIKNPVVSLSNGLDLVRRKIGVDRELSEVGEEMSRQLRRIERAVRDLLAYARPRAPERAPTDLDAAVRRSLVLVEPVAVKAGVAVKLHSNPHLPSIEVDADQIQQAIVNLTINAVQHSKAGDTVSIASDIRGDKVEISVHDTGTGMDPATLDQLFKPFFTTRHAGTGLGLSISRGIVERHGGQLTVESTLGEGSTFTIALPLDQGATE